MSFTKATLETAMNKLAQAGKIFSNESQFQFDLAWELRKMGFDVELEVLSADCTPSQFAALPKEDKKRYYTDIVIKDDNEFIAIELKYKTPDKGVMHYTTGSGDYYVFPQGAENISSYLYWKDVERLESLVYKKVPLNFNNTNYVKKGYAILLTNDKFYKFGNKRQAINGGFGSLAKEFFTIDGTTVSGTRYWYIKVDAYVNRVSANAPLSGGVVIKRIDTMADIKKYQKKKEDLAWIDLSGEYLCNWQNYCCDITNVSGIDKTGKQMLKNISDYSFSYLLLEV